MKIKYRLHLQAVIGIRRRPTLPDRYQSSTIGTEGLNFCVRYGNRWDPFVIATGNGELFFSHTLTTAQRQIQSICQSISLRFCSASAVTQSAFDFRLRFLDSLRIGAIRRAKARMAL